MKVFKWLLPLTLCIFLNAGASEQIFNKESQTLFTRYDFTYESTDIDGSTPITLSGAIFMSNMIKTKISKPKGYVILNHYTSTSDEERPTAVTSFGTMEGVLALSGYIIIESDGIGFGQTVDRRQPYLVGRVSAKNNIDAYISGKRLMEAEGFNAGTLIANVGYSQGAHTAMWVNRLISEGYRSDQIDHIDMSIVGGGPYDIYKTYLDLLEHPSHYPVAVPLVAWGVIAEGIAPVRPEQIIKPDLVPGLERWLDSKVYNTSEVNSELEDYTGLNVDDGIPVSAMMTPDFSNPQSTVMQSVIQRLKANSLVYEPWSPKNTREIYFMHSTGDEVVPFLNLGSMTAHLTTNGYTDFIVDDSKTGTHGDTGTEFALFAATKLPTATGVEEVQNSTDTTTDVYDMQGRLLKQNVPYADALTGLTSGWYVVNNRLVLK